MKTFLYQRLKTNIVMLLNAGSLVATFAVTSGLGFFFWWVAARLFSPEAVGFASAAISAMTLLGTICILGLGTLLIRELPRQAGKEVPLISTSLIVVSGVAGATGLLFAVVAPSFSADLQPLRASIQNGALFTVGVSLAAVSLVLDQALIGLLRGDLQLWRNTLYAAIKLVALFVASLWFSQKVGLTIYATWAIANALSLVALAEYALLKGKWDGRITPPHLGLLRQMGPSALQHHLLNLVLLGPATALPVLVAILISATADAWFYVSLTLANIVYIFPNSLVTSLYAVGSTQPTALAHKARLTLGLTLLACVLANCALFFGSRQLLGFFGQSYAQHGTWILPILGLEAIPYTIKYHYIVICRIQDRITKALLPLTAGALLELAAAASGARLGGLAGLSLGWLIAVCVEAILMSGLVYKTIRPISTPTNQDQPQCSAS